MINRVLNPEYYSLSFMELIRPPDVMMFWMNGGKGCA